MGLGTLLFNADEIAERLKGKRESTRPENGGRVRKNNNNGNASSAPTTALFSDPGEYVESTGSSITSPEPPEEQEEALFVILWPALGCPALVDPVERSLEIIFLSLAEQAEVTIEYVRRLIRYINIVIWDRRPYAKDNSKWDPGGWPLDENLVKSDSIIIQEVMTLERYRDEAEKKYFKFGGFFHTINGVIPEVYCKKNFKSVVSIRLTLKEILDYFKLGQMYTLYYPPENGLLRRILDDESLLEKPYNDIPLMKNNGHSTIGGPDQVFRGRSGTRAREHLVRLFHPFMIVKETERDYLSVGHVTDLHISTLWDYFEHQIFPDFDHDKYGKSEIENGQIKDRKAKSGFEAIGSRYNNPNLNVRHLTQVLNNRTGANCVDIILQTGDLIDFNRGFNFNPDHDPDRDYEFNLNWIRYYELLLMDYERPTYTALGNHDLRLNPYPPHITPEAVHYIFLPLFGLLTGAGAGASCGFIYGILEKEKRNVGDDEQKLISILQILVVPLIAPIVLFLFLSLLLGFGWDWDTAMDMLINKNVTWWFLLIGWGLWLLLDLPLIGLIDEGPGGMDFPQAGAFWGSILGGAFFVSLAIVLILLPFEIRNYMNKINNLYCDDFSRLLNKNVEYLRAFGKDGLFYMTQRSSDWYALVINPFLDYAFRHGNMFLMMGSWDGSEVLIGNPPPADDSFSDRQWGLITAWIDELISHRRNIEQDKEVIPIIGLHTPVFCPQSDLDLDRPFPPFGLDTADDSLTRGTMTMRRDQFIKLAGKLGGGTDSRISKRIPFISLTGHTHVYDIFHMETEDSVKWYQLDVPPWEESGWVTNKCLHITTACAGPPADGMPEEIDPGWVAPFQTELRRLDAEFDNTYDKDLFERALISVVSFLTDPPKVYEYWKTVQVKGGQRALRPAGCRVLIFERAAGRILDIEEISAKTSKWGDS